MLNFLVHDRMREREHGVQHDYRNWLRVPNINQRNQNRSKIISPHCLFTLSR